MQLPPLKIDYLRSFTDDTGIFQHAKFGVPRRSDGYTTDDNARALIACTRHHLLNNDPEMESLANVYLAFLFHMQKPQGNFHNYLGYDRNFLDVDGSDDCMGRTLWSCGCAVNSALPKDTRLASMRSSETRLMFTRWYQASVPASSLAHTSPRRESKVSTPARTPARSRSVALVINTNLKSRSDRAA